MDYITCTKAYDQEAINLIRRVFNPKMTEKYPLLLGQDNLDHRLIAIHENKVVGVVSYVLTPIHLGLFSLNLASIGAVTTHPDFRGQGIASTLLNLAEAKMKAEETDLVVISGDLGIYRRFGADHLSLMASFTLPQVRSDYALIEVLPKDFPNYYELYRQQPFIFQRSKTEFKTLVKAVVSEDPWEQSYFHGMVLDGSIVGYLVLNTRPQRNYGVIREFAGSAKALIGVTGLLMEKYDLKQVKLELAHNDPQVLVLNALGLHHKHLPMESTMKILDFNRLIDKLQPYFEYVLGDDHDDLFIRYYDGLYQFRFKDAHYETSDFHEAQHILFGPYDNSDLIGNPISEVFSTLFPLPFVYTSNMNYQ